MIFFEQNFKWTKHKKINLIQSQENSTHSDKKKAFVTAIFMTWFHDVGNEMDAVIICNLLIFLVISSRKSIWEKKKSYVKHSADFYLYIHLAKVESKVEVVECPCLKPGSSPLEQLWSLGLPAFKVDIMMEKLCILFFSKSSWFELRWRRG